MRSKTLTTLLALAGLSSGSSQLQAGFDLFDYAFNIDGVVTASPGVPAGVNDAGFNYSTGLGSITVALGAAGPHFVGLFLDHEIDEAINTFFNEVGTSIGAPAAGQSWEIDEPGFVFGDIYTNFTGSNAVASALDNTTAFPPADDVSMALGSNFLLGAGETGYVTFLVSDVAPASGFYLQHTDPDSNSSIFFSSSTRIDSGVIPEPATAIWGVALLAMFAADRRRRARDS